MQDLTLINIQELLQVRDQMERIKGSDLDSIPSIRNAFLEIKNGRVFRFGSMEDYQGSANELNIVGKFVLPAFVDSHTHLVFAAPREKEFVQKIQGASYADIAAKGGGILNSAKRLREMDEDDLLEGALKRANQLMHDGTATVEIKSGYGLTLKDEIKMLRVAKKVGELTPLVTRATFLGAHAVPPEMNRSQYLDLVMNEMIPQVAEEKLATFIDVFCEEGFFSEEDSIRVLERGKEYGLVPKVHANQLNLSGGVQAGIKVNAISVDHLETVSEKELDLLEDSEVIATALPGAAFFLRMTYPPIRSMIERDLCVAVASDFNPGSSPAWNMQTIWSLATIGMKMTPTEALNAMTINGAFAMMAEEQSGVIQVGRRADLIITKSIPSIDYIPYSFGEDCIEQVLINGQTVRV